VNGWRVFRSPAAGKAATTPASSSASLASSGSLATLLNQFRRIGAGESVGSWIGQGPNKPLQQHQIREVIDTETLHELSQHTGLDKEELVERIARELPEVVDRLTPDGRLPQASTDQLSAARTHGKLDQEPAEGEGKP